MSQDNVLTTLDLPLERVASGKVREIFSLDAGHLLFVATDRISAYDVIMPQGIPGKGRLLTAMSLFWFERLAGVCPNHLADQPVPGHLGVEGRGVVVRKLQMLPVEFVVRGYLAGSGWSDYRATGSVCGVTLPKGLEEAAQLPEPIFTPATKASSGHDENISEDLAADIVGPDVLKTARDYAVTLYRQAAEHAMRCGIIIADTKFEFGLLGGEVILADEVLTPDSSRFWPASQWEPGRTPPSYDKQYLRDWLDASGWDHTPPPPDLPDHVVANTRAKYEEAHSALTGRRPD